MRLNWYGSERRLEVLDFTMLFLSMKNDLVYTGSTGCLLFSSAKWMSRAGKVSGS